MIVRRIYLDEVKVPARPDSINSPEIDQPLHKLPNGAKKGWTQQFDEISKTILRIECDNGVIGLGESYRGVAQATLQEIATALLGCDLRALNLQALPLGAGRSYDGFECALADACARSHDLPLYRMLGGSYRETVCCAFWTGHRTIADAVRKAKEAVRQGFGAIKFKCELSDPVVEWCQEIFDACGTKLSVILDPNERFIQASHAERIAGRLAPIGNVLYLEDPIPRWDYESWAHLRRKSQVPLSMHISLPYAEMGQMEHDAARAARALATDYFNFNGGIYAYRRLAALADLFGMSYSHGSEIDLGILEASYLHKSASAAGNKLPSDIFGRLVREHDLLKEPLEIVGGEASVPQKPGLGVELDMDAVRHYGISHWEVEG
jgi:muconate cycloisomerase